MYFLEFLIALKGQYSQVITHSWVWNINYHFMNKNLSCGTLYIGLSSSTWVLILLEGGPWKEIQFFKVSLKPFLASQNVSENWYICHWSWSIFINLLLNGSCYQIKLSQKPLMDIPLHSTHFLQSNSSSLPLIIGPWRRLNVKACFRFSISLDKKTHIHICIPY